MLTICWFYCLPFTQWLFYASSPLLFVFSVFMLKRGMEQMRPRLRAAAFILMFMAGIKGFIFDSLLLGRSLGLGVAAMTAYAGMLFIFYRRTRAERAGEPKNPRLIRLALWSRLGFILVLLLIARVATPWIGYLTAGQAPAFIKAISWDFLATITAAVLLTGFWKLEECRWIHSSMARREAYATRTWTPRDTLVLAAALFLIALGLSYVSADVLRSSY